MAVMNAIYSKNSDEWRTPADFFEKLDEEFSFDYDPCASDENHLCSSYSTIADNGLSTDWGGKRVFCNPPYSQIKLWVEKAFRESKKDNTVVVMLLPARTDTRYFHDFIYHRAEVRLVKGRLKFNGSKNPAPFPNMVVIFRGAYAD